MKLLAARIFAALFALLIIAGCATQKQESAMEWLERQPWSSDGPS